MKKLLILLSLSLFLTSCVDTNEKPYYIQTESNGYWVESYEQVDANCIRFEVSCTCDGDTKEITVCGNYQITKYRKDEGRLRK